MAGDDSSLKEVVETMCGVHRVTGRVTGRVTRRALKSLRVNKQTSTVPDSPWRTDQDQEQQKRNQRAFMD